EKPLIREHARSRLGAGARHPATPRSALPPLKLDWSTLVRLVLVPSSTMDCPSCGHPNREGARFCAQCATRLIETVTCPSCGTVYPPAARHCDSCGEALADAAAPIHAPDRRTHPPEHPA